MEKLSVAGHSVTMVDALEKLDNLVAYPMRLGPETMDRET